MNTTFAKTKKWLMVLLVALAVVALTAAIVLIALTGANAKIITVANETELSQAIANVERGKYGNKTVIVKLTNNISLDNSLASNCTYTLDLNGYALTYAGSEEAPVITVSDGKLTLTDGAKANGTVTGGTDGGIIVDGGSLALNGGVITGNTTSDSAHAGGIYVAEGSKISVAGAPVVSNNTANGVENNLYLPGDTNVSIGDLSAAANIGVTLDSKRVFTQGYANSSAGAMLQLNGFTSDDLDKKVTVVNSEIMAIAVGDVVMVDGNYYNDIDNGWGQVGADSIVTLLDDVEISTTLTGSKGNLTLDLNGHMLSYNRTNNPVVFLTITNANTRMTFTLLDSNPTGIVHEGLYNPLATGSNRNVDITGGVIYGGQYGVSFRDSTSKYIECYFQGGTVMAAANDGIYFESQHASSAIHMFGGAVVSYNNRYGVNVNTAKTLSIQSSKINNNGFGGIYANNASLSLDGGEICNNGLSDTVSNVEPKNYKTGVYLVDSTSQLTVTNTKIDGNKAQGVVVNSSSKMARIEMTGAIITSNGTETSLPGIDVTGIQVTINNCTLSQNGSYGAKMTADFDINVYKSVFDGNGSDGINANVEALNVNNTSLSGNGGNGVTFTGNVVTLAGCEVNNNVAKGASFALSGVEHTATVNSSNINNNGTEGINSNGILKVGSASKLQHNGNSGVYFNGTDVTIDDTTLIGNGSAHKDEVNAGETDTPVTVDVTKISNVYVTDASNVTINGCNMAEAVGRSIHIVGTAINATVSNSAIYSSAGAINVVADSGEVTVDGCEIFDNETADEGAGIRIEMTKATSTVTLKNLDVTNNTTALSGGGIYVSLVPTSGDANVNWNGVRASGNTANGYNVASTDDFIHGGGGVYLNLRPSAGSVNVDIVDSSLNNNVAAVRGGGLNLRALAYGAITVNMNGFYADGNKANGSSTYTDYGGGGAALTLDSTNSDINVNIDNAIVEHNTSTRWGCGLMMQGKSQPDAKNVSVTIKNSKFNENHSNQSVGLGVRFYKGAGTTGTINVTVEKVEVCNNTTGNDTPGAYFYLQPGDSYESTVDATFKDVHCDGNVSSGTGNNGGLYVWASGAAYGHGDDNNVENGDVRLTLEDSTCCNNTIGGGYGGLYFYGYSFNGSSYVTIKNTKINNNTAGTNYGGAFISSRVFRGADKSKHDSANIVIDNVEVHDNTAGGYIGGVDLYTYHYGNAYTGDTTQIKQGEVHTTITNMSLQRNTAGGYIGGLRIYSRAYCTSAQWQANKGPQSSVNIDGMKLIDNTSLDGYTGGAFVEYYSGYYPNSTINDVTVTGNTCYAPSYEGDSQYGVGGGLCVYNNAAEAHTTLTKLIVKNNYAPYGGGLEVLSNTHECYATVDDSIIENNTAGIRGGGLYVHTRSTATITKTEVTVKNTQIKNNVAPEGGGIAVHSIKPLTDTTWTKLFLTDGAEITANKANVGGGVEVGDNSIIDLSGSIEIYNNKNNSGNRDSNLFLSADNIINVSELLKNTHPIQLSFDFVYSGKVVTKGLNKNGTENNFGMDDPLLAGFVEGATELTLEFNTTQIYLEHASGDPTSYSSFTAAYAAAKETDVIKLNADVFVAIGENYGDGKVDQVTGITVSKKVTIDLNGYMLQTSVTSDIEIFFEVVAGGKLTIKDSTYNTDKFGEVTHFLTSQRTTVLEEIKGGIIKGTIRLNGGDVDFLQGNVSDPYGDVNTTEYRSGIVWKSGALTMTDDSAICCGIGNGLYIYQAGTFEVTAGKFYGNASYGIAAAIKSVNLTVGEVDVYENRDGGLYVIANSSVTVDGAEIHGNGNRGIYVNGAGTLTIEDAHIYDNKYIAKYGGIEITGNNRVVNINGGTFHDNYYGVYIYSGNNAKVTIKNAEFYNETYGVCVNHYTTPATTDPKVVIGEGTKIHDCTHGIYIVLAGDILTIEGGEIYNNTTYGVYVYPRLYHKDTVVTMTGGSIHDNKSYGMYIVGYHSNTTEEYYGIDAKMTFNMSGGSISNNGNGVYMNSYDYYAIVANRPVTYRWNSVMNMTGGTITGNKTYGIYLYTNAPGASTKLTLGSGSVINITGNGTYNVTALSWWSNVNYPLIHPESKDVNGFVAQISITGKLAAGSRIGISSNRTEAYWEDERSANGRTLFYDWNASYWDDSIFFTDLVYECLVGGVLYHSHEIELVDAKEATCTQTGWISYYKCTRCEHLFSDEAGTKAITKEDTVVGTKDHVYEWQQIANDKYNDKYVCKDCGDVSIASQAHNYTKFSTTPTTGSDGTYYGWCGKCGWQYTFNCTDNGNFEGAPQHVAITTWEERTAEYHATSMCLICRQRDIKANHVLSGEWVETGDSSHRQDCVVCSYTRTLDGEKHDLDGIWLKSDDGKHYQTCLGCGKKVEVEGQGHELDGVWVKNPEGDHKQTCKLCGMELEQVGIEHNTSAWTDSGNGNNHKANCDMCGIVMYDAHETYYSNVWTSEKVGYKQRECTLCGYVQQVVCEHAKTTAKNSITTHWNECTLCTAHINEAAHVVAKGGWSYMTVSLHHGICSVCGKDVVADHVAEEKYNQYNRDENYHYQLCADCGDQINHEEHNFEWTLVESDVYNGKCTVCGIEKTQETHNFSTSLTYTDETGHYKKCADCDAIIEFAPHNMKWDTAVANKHSYICQDGCGYNPIDGNHVYGSYKAVMNDDGSTTTHSRACTYCGVYDTDNNVANKHTDPVTFNNGDEHGTWCPICQYVFTSDKHDYVWVDSGDGSTHYQQCECGERGLTANHVFGDSFGYDNNSKHYQVCTRCAGKGGYADHDVKYVSRAGAGHQATCPTCNWEGGVVAHDWSEYKAGETGHYRHCNTCGYDTAETPHDYTNARYYIEPLYHYQNCTVCGAKGEQVTHNWDGVHNNQNGTHSAACTDCKYSTGDEPDDCNLVYNPDSELNTTTVHALICTVCGWETTEEHNANKANNDDEKHWKECSVCEYVDEDDKIEHIKSDKATATADKTQHYYKCTDCAFTYTEEGHNATGEYLYSADGHWQLCQDCGVAASDPITHVYTSFTPHEIDRNNGPESDGTHTGYCGTCDYHNDELKCNFIFSDDPAEEHNGYCEDCEAKTLMPHIYNIPNYDENNHWLECVCKQIDNNTLRKHEYPAKGTKADDKYHTYACTCTLQDAEGKTYQCEYAKSAEHNFGPETVQKSATYHWYVCPDCGAETTAEEHTPGTKGVSNEDGTHDVSCTICGRDITVDCTYEIGARKDSDFHYLHCTTCDFNDVGTHDYTLRDKDDDNHWLKCECGEINEESRVAHSLDNITPVDGGHTFFCPVCEYQSDKRAHEYEEDEYLATPTGHYQECTVCGQATTPVAHDNNVIKSNKNGTHTAYCSVCDYKHADQTDDCEYIYVDNGDGSHTGTCAICEDEVTEDHHYTTLVNTDSTNHWYVCKECEAKDDSSVKAHNYGGTKDYDAGDGTHYRHCDDCGYNTTPVAHVINGWKTDAQEGTHWQECVFCDYKSARNPHVFEGDAISDGNGKHAQKCSACETIGQTVDCTYVYSTTDSTHTGTCTECGYKADPESHNTNTTNYDSDYHWNECSVCGYVNEANKHAHTYNEQGETCDECAHPYVDELAEARQAAIDAINEAANTAKAAMTSDIADLYKQMIDKAVKGAIDTINHATEEDVITSAKDACIVSIDEISMRYARDDAKAQLDEKATEIINSLNTVLPEAYKSSIDSTYIPAINSILTNAKQLVSDAQNTAQVAKALADGLAALDKVVLDTTKTIARNTITAEANTAKSRVSGSANAAELQATIDKEADLARANINKATSVADVEAAKVAGVEILQGFDATSDPDEKQEEYEDRVHECSKKCPECKGCLDPDCDYSACATKCTHKCDSKCPAPGCGKCTDPTCGHADCLDKCDHVCNNKCPDPDCGLCTDPNCEHAACQDKCEHTCSNVCDECNKCTDPNCEHAACQDKCQGHDKPVDPEPEDPVAKAKVASEAAMNGEKSTALGKVGATGKYADAINAAWNTYKTALENATTLEDITAAEAAFKDVINAQLLAHAQDQALADLEKKKQDAIDSLPKDLPQEERDKYLDAIEKEFDDAKKEIEGATDPDAIGDVVDGVEDKMDDAILDTGKDIASDKIDQEAQAKKDEIENNPDLSREEKDALQKVIDEEAERAKGKVDDADSLDEVKDEEKRGGDIMKDVVENPDPDLQQAKSEARDTLDKAADDKYKEIEDKLAKGEITEEQAAEMKKKVDEATKEANNNVNKSTTPDEAKQEAEKGKDSIDKVKTEPSNFFDKVMDWFENTPLPLGIVGITAGAMILLIIILSIAARKPKKK